MSSELKAILNRVAEENYSMKKEELEEGLERYKFLILKILKLKKWDLAIWVEGSETNLEKYEKNLELLERSKLVKSQTKYTERNAYHEYKLTKKGTELAEKLLKEI